MQLNIEQAAQGFAAVGSEPRLAVLMALVRVGHDGLSVGQIQDRVKLPASTLAHHLRFLTDAGLIEQEKIGRTVINRASFGYIEELAGYLVKECCVEAAPRQRKSA